MSLAKSTLRRIARLGLAVALAGALALPPAAQPALARPTLPQAYVVDRDDDANEQACTPAINDCTLRGAVNRSNTDASDSTITFSSNFTITLDSPLVISATNTTIYAPPTQWVGIDADNNGQVFRISASDTTLEGLRMYGSALLTAIVWISDSAQRVRLAKNLIGDDGSGFSGPCDDSPNSQSGIYISSSAIPTATNAVAWIYGNFIVCVGGHGIQIAGSNEVVIGADSAGNAGGAQANFIDTNGGDAVHLGPGSDFNTIRNSYLQYGGGSGLVIDGGDSNSVYGNYMQHNDAHGILLTGGARVNSIGCPLLSGDPDDADLRNVIQQNDGDGIRISGDGTDSNLILCNWIGLGDDGTNAAANLGNGVRIGEGAANNVIGAGPTTRNAIGGNNLSGVLLVGPDTHHNLVQGNYIGTNAAGTAAVGNELDGVRLMSGAVQNTIGGTSFGLLNLIGGNDGFGIFISGSDTATNTIKYNDIGLNTDNLPYIPLPNGTGGIRLQSNTHGNIIGGPSHANYIAYNTGDGVSLTGGVKATQLGVNQVFNNTANGVALSEAATTGNTLTGLIVYNNGRDGIAELLGSTLNVWQTLSVYGNGGLGIDKFADNSAANTPNAPYPVITSINPGTGQIQGTASPNALVELYRAAPDPVGFGEGGSFAGSVVANGAGAWSITLDPSSNICYTAFQTLAGVSSEFGPHTCPMIYLPVVLREE